MNSKTADFKFSLRTSLLVGAIGGFLFAAYDIINVISQNILFVPTFFHLFPLIAWPLVIHIFLGAFGLGFLSSLAFLSAQSGRLKFRRQNFLALSIAFFVLLASFLAFVAPFEAGNALQSGYFFHSFFFGTLGALGCYFLTSVLLNRFSSNQLIKWGSLALFGLTALWLISLWFIIQINFNRGLATTGLKQKNIQPAEINPPQSWPNILWIVMDAARADHLSAYGYQRQTTPNIDALAQESVLYQNAISAAPWTLPSHASMLTSLFPSQHGTDSIWPWLDENFTTLSEVLHQRGYHTAGFSNNTFFSSAQNFHQGFDVFKDFGNFFKELSAELLLARYIKIFKASFHIQGNFLRLDSLHKRLMIRDFRRDAGADRTNRLVKNYLEEIKTSNRPFFIIINYMEVHSPYGDTPLEDLYFDAININQAQADHTRDLVQDVKLLATGKTIVTPQDKQILEALYDADLHYLDSKIAELVAYLRTQEILDNTILIITSDHGENLGDHNLVNHLYDIHHTLTHVPLIIRYPPLFPAGTQVTRIVQLTDIFPTLLDILEINDFDRSQLSDYSLFDTTRPQVAFSEAQWNRNISKNIKAIFNQVPDLDQRLLGGSWKSVHQGGYDYVSTPSKDYLYNLNQDTEETNNLINSQLTTARNLRQTLINWLFSFQHYWQPFWSKEGYD